MHQAPCQRQRISGPKHLKEVTAKTLWGYKSAPESPPPTGLASAQTGLLGKTRHPPSGPALCGSGKVVDGNQTAPRPVTSLALGSVTTYKALPLGQVPCCHSGPTWNPRVGKFHLSPSGLLGRPGEGCPRLLPPAAGETGIVVFAIVM